MRELILKGIQDGTLCNKMTQIPVQDIQAPEGVELLAVGLGEDPECYMYGKMVVYMTCHGRYFCCMYHVHLPHQVPLLANHMEYIHELVRKSYGYTTYTDCRFGLKAFWMHTPTATLTGDDLTLRLLMNALKRYSVDNKLCKRLRKTDKAYLRHEPDWAI